MVVEMLLSSGSWLHLYFDRPASRVCHKHRWACPAQSRTLGEWTQRAVRIAAQQIAFVNRVYS